MKKKSWDVTPATHRLTKQTCESRTVFCVGRIRNCIWETWPHPRHLDDENARKKGKRTLGQQNNLKASRYIFYLGPRILFQNCALSYYSTSSNQYLWFKKLFSVISDNYLKLRGQESQGKKVQSKGDRRWEEPHKVWKRRAKIMPNVEMFLPFGTIFDE